MRETQRSMDDPSPPPLAAPTSPKVFVTKWRCGDVAKASEKTGLTFEATNEINFLVANVQSRLSSYIRATQDQFSAENSFMIYQLAGTLTLIGVLISMWHMTSHLRNFHQPSVQRKILAILWMCPIYSVTSWLSLVVPTLEGYLDILKDLYEAYVIYNFMSFLVAVLSGKDGDRDAVVELLARHAEHLSAPWQCSRCCRSRRGDGDLDREDERRRLADEVLMQCQVCAMQFVFLRPLLTATSFLLKELRYRGPLFGPGSPFDPDGVVEGDEDGVGGMMDYRTPQFYIVILENVSVFLAFSGLLKFYHAVQDDLSWCRPFPKFLCIKGVVFMTFWQGIAISLLASTTDVLGVAGEKVSVGKGDMDEEDQAEVLAKQAQNFLICIEMLGFSIAHFYCFPVEEWEEGYRPVEDKGKFGDNMALGDFLHDLKLIMRHKERRKRAAKEKSGSKPMSDDSISTVLEEDEELGGSDSNDGLRSLLVDVEGLLEGEDVDGPSASRRREDSSTAGADPGADHQQQPTPRTLYRKSVQESLRAMDAPRELRAATALLLQSTLLDEDTARLLTSDILEQPLEPEARGDDKGGGAERTGGEDASPYEVEQKLPPEDSDDRESAAEEEPLSNHEPSTGENATTSGETAEPSESTSLLMAPSKNDDMLRPSIFTMHSTSPPDA